MDLLHEIEAIRKQYAPDDDYITLSVRGGHYSINNSYWLHPDENVIDCWMDEGDADIYSNRPFKKEEDEYAEDAAG